MDDIRSKIRDVNQIPALPESVNTVLSAMKDPSVSAKDITEMITHDIAISSKLLKVVNSAYYGYRGNITSVTHAIVMLGFNTVKNLVISLSLYPLLERVKAVKDFPIYDFWTHCVAVGCTAKIIATLVGRRNREEFFTYGLMHDIGKLALLSVSPGVFLESVKEAKRSNRPLYVVELEKTEWTHPAVAYELFLHWKMPEPLVEVVSYHHDKDLVQSNEQVKIVHLADQMVKFFGFGDSGDGNVLESQEEEIFRGWTKEDIKAKIEAEIQSAEVFLNFLKGESDG